MDIHKNNGYIIQFIGFLLGKPWHWISTGTCWILWSLKTAIALLPARARPLVWSYRPTTFCDKRFSNYQKKSPIVQQYFTYRIIYIVYCLYLLAFMVYNSPNIHDYLYYTDYTYIQNIPFLSPGFPAKAPCQPQTWKRARPGRPVLEIRLMRNGQGLSFIVMDIMGIDVSNLKAVNISTCDCMCIHIFSKHINNVL